MKQYVLINKKSSKIFCAIKICYYDDNYYINYKTVPSIEMSLKTSYEYYDYGIYDPYHNIWIICGKEITDKYLEDLGEL